MRTVVVYSDYVCPFCFLAEARLKHAAEERGLALDWRPFELRWEPTPTLRPEDEYLPRVWRQSVYPLAASLGVPIRLPSVSPQPYSRLAFEGFQHAKAHGLAAEYNHAVFAAFFQQDQDIGRPDVLTQLATAIGLDAAAFRTDLDRGVYAATHRQALLDAEAEDIRSVPTIVVGRRHLAGLPHEDDLAELLDEAA